MIYIKQVTTTGNWAIYKIKQGPNWKLTLTYENKPKEFYKTITMKKAKQYEISNLEEPFTLMQYLGEKGYSDTWELLDQNDFDNLKVSLL